MQSFLLTQFSILVKGRRESFKYTLGSDCIDLHTMESLSLYICHQHEADTKMFYHVSKIVLEDSVKLIVIDAEEHRFFIFN